MILLAFETATEACSVALWIDGAVHERFELAPRRHAELSLPWATQLMAEAGIARSQLDAIGVGRGPGAFTGVRLAIALAQGIALALDRPVLPVSTLAALAMRAGAPSNAPGMRPAPSSAPAGEGRGGGQPDHHILAAIDARMGEVYSATFLREGDDLRALSMETVTTPDDVTLPGEGNDWLGVGTGFAALDGHLQSRLQSRLVHVDASALPHAADVAHLAALAFARGEAIAADNLQPAYLRDNVALTLQEQQVLRDSR